MDPSFHHSASESKFPEIEGTEQEPPQQLTDTFNQLTSYHQNSDYKAHQHFSGTPHGGIHVNSTDYNFLQSGHIGHERLNFDLSLLPFKPDTSERILELSRSQENLNEQIISSSSAPLSNFYPSPGHPSEISEGPTLLEEEVEGDISYQACPLNEPLAYISKLPERELMSDANETLLQSLGNFVSHPEQSYSTDLVRSLDNTEPNNLSSDLFETRLDGSCSPRDQNSFACPNSSPTSLIKPTMEPLPIKPNDKLIDTYVTSPVFPDGSTDYVESQAIDSEFGTLISSAKLDSPQVPLNEPKGYEQYLQYRSLKEHSSETDRSNTSPTTTALTSSDADVKHRNNPYNVKPTGEDKDIQQYFEANQYHQPKPRQQIDQGGDNIFNLTESNHHIFVPSDIKGGGDSVDQITSDRQLPFSSKATISELTSMIEKVSLSENAGHLHQNGGPAANHYNLQHHGYVPSSNGMYANGYHDGSVGVDHMNRKYEGLNVAGVDSNTHTEEESDSEDTDHEAQHVSNVVNQDSTATTTHGGDKYTCKKGEGQDPSRDTDFQFKGEHQAQKECANGDHVIANNHVTLKSQDQHGHHKINRNEAPKRNVINNNTNNNNHNNITHSIASANQNKPPSHHNSNSTTFNATKQGTNPLKLTPLSGKKADYSYVQSKCGSLSFVKPASSNVGASQCDASISYSASNSEHGDKKVGKRTHTSALFQTNKSAGNSAGVGLNKSIGCTPTACPSKNSVMTSPYRKPDYLKNVQSKIGSLPTGCAAKSPLATKPLVVRDASQLQSQTDGKQRLSHHQSANTNGHLNSTRDNNIHQHNKIDLKNVKSKVGSFDNARYTPSGGNVKIQTFKLNFKEKASPKVQSKTAAKSPQSDQEEQSLSFSQRGEGMDVSEGVH